MLLLLPQLLQVKAFRPDVIINIGVGALIVALAYAMVQVTGNFPQWTAVGFGYYAVFSWASALRARDPAWGIRQLDDVAAQAERHGLALQQRHAMPANNLLLVFAAAAS